MNLNHRYSIIIFLTLFIFLQACKDDDQDAPVPASSGNVLLVFENYVDNQPVEFGNLIYTNDAGNLYSIDMLKYYISNIVFQKSDLSVISLNNYELVNEAYDTSRSFMVSLPYGDYTKMRFMLGVDSVKSTTGAQAGELDPAFGMFWDWSTGYVYLKHEGNFIDAIGDTLPVVYHYGGMPAITYHEFDLTLPVSSTQRIIKVRFNLNKLYRSPNVVDFNNNNIHSGGTNWVNTIRENLDGAFEIVGVL